MSAQPIPIASKKRYITPVDTRSKIRNPLNVKDKGRTVIQIAKDDMSLGLVHRAWKLYEVLIGYFRPRGECFPGDARLRNDIRASQRTLVRARKQLADAGLIECWRRKGFRRDVYGYRFPFHAIFEMPNGGTVLPVRDAKLPIRDANQSISSGQKNGLTIMSSGVYDDLSEPLTNTLTNTYKDISPNPQVSVKVTQERPLPPVADIHIGRKNDLCNGEGNDTQGHTSPGQKNTAAPGATKSEAITPGSPSISAAPAEAEIERAFEACWKVWPRKYKRFIAKKAFRKHATSHEKMALIVSQAARHAPVLAQRDLPFVPYLSTWIEKFYYLEEPEKLDQRPAEKPNPYEQW